MSPLAIMRMAGHTNFATTQRYLNLRTRSSAKRYRCSASGTGTPGYKVGVPIRAQSARQPASPIGNSWSSSLDVTTTDQTGVGHEIGMEKVRELPHAVRQPRSRSGEVAVAVDRHGRAGELEACGSFGCLLGAESTRAKNNQLGIEFDHFFPGDRPRRRRGPPITSRPPASAIISGTQWPAQNGGPGYPQRTLASARDPGQCRLSP